MTEDVFYTSRLLGLPVLDADGNSIGRIVDVVLAAPSATVAPRVLGYVANVQRRHIFVNTGRVAEFNAFGVRLLSGRVDLRQFRRRRSELTAKALLDRKVGSEVLRDIGISPSRNVPREWEVTVVVLGHSSLRRRRAVRIVPWSDAAALFEADSTPLAREVVRLRDMHPADVAAELRAMPMGFRRQVLAALDDDELADVLEELPEEEQVVIVEALGVDRAAAVIEEMDPDDAADLLSELEAGSASALLEAMDAVEAGDLRRLMAYDENTAGGLMTSEPLVCDPYTTVAAALAKMRDPNITPSVAAQIFVVEPPTVTPTGRFLGTVHFQRLLREAPGLAVGRFVDADPAPVAPDTPDTKVAIELAAYNLLAVPVCDAEGRLVGAVSVDDVLDRTLPADWRELIR